MSKAARTKSDSSETETDEETDMTIIRPNPTVTRLRHSSHGSYGEGQIEALEGLPWKQVKARVGSICVVRDGGRRREDCFCEAVSPGEDIRKKNHNSRIISSVTLTDMINHIHSQEWKLHYRASRPV